MSTKSPMEDIGRTLLRELVEEYASHFGRDADDILSQPFTKLIPLSSRPYGRLYAY